MPVAPPGQFSGNPPVFSLVQKFEESTMVSLSPASERESTPLFEGERDHPNRTAVSCEAHIYGGEEKHTPSFVHLSRLRFKLARYALVRSVNGHKVERCKSTGLTKPRERISLLVIRKLTAAFYYCVLEAYHLTHQVRLQFFNSGAHWGPTTLTEAVTVETSLHLSIEENQS
ncbi:hypothetical protein CROQUDRAFT_87575 [Cronartium quercuum f. sp. fusiforme G11]|uniref:Uncharacterized protein n=1 Tax=Cronartium quercuum f. sp. fusiforme G11 TaxID=708437 RepID=A0A9P6TFK5_9BASI|nr:hypothetical protein CROQUDRAFT_87575 [Cronartium quercuum f. sp. fusiforme G11]